MPDRLLRPGVLDVLLDAAMIVSSDLRVIAANAGARALLFGTGDDTASKQLLAFVVPEDAPRLVDALDYARRGARGYASLHVKLLTEAGEPVHTELRIAALGQRRRTDTYLLTAPNTALRRTLAPGGDFYSLAVASGER